MDCPECGGPLDAYVLDGREASICERCGRVGIEADHRGKGQRTESWDDALRRFYEHNVETGRRRSDLPPVAAASGGPGGESVAEPDEDAGDQGDDTGSGEDDAADSDEAETGAGADAGADETGGDESDADGAEADANADDTGSVETEHDGEEDEESDGVDEGEHDGEEDVGGNGVDEAGRDGVEDEVGNGVDEGERDGDGDEGGNGGSDARTDDSGDAAPVEDTGEGAESRTDGTDD